MPVKSLEVPALELRRKKICAKLQNEEQTATRATWLPICTMECFICCVKNVSSGREISGNAFFCFCFRVRVRAGFLGAKLEDEKFSCSRRRWVLSGSLVKWLV
jgi:hypothetical protein